MVLGEVARRLGSIPRLSGTRFAAGCTTVVMRIRAAGRSLRRCWPRSLAQAATRQLLAALPFVAFGQTGAEPALLEFDRGYNSLRESVLATPLAFADGSVDVPRGPGLGVEVDEDAVRGYELTA
ncbi:MAG TPA: enolase C-terminal domain-like protein [Streptosporangiaceae bacterium]